MSEKEKRINKVKEAYKLLYDKGLIHSKNELAIKMGVSRVSVTLAVNGDEKYATENFLRKIYETFPGVFNPKWLLNEEGSMTMDDEQQRDHTTVQDIISLSAQLIKQNEELRALLIEEIKRTTELREELIDTLAEIRASALETFQKKFDNSTPYLAEHSTIDDPSPRNPSKPYRNPTKKSI